MKRWVGVAIALALVTGCGWTQYAGNAGRTAFAPLETTLTTANIGDAIVQWTSDRSRLGEPVIANGFVYSVNYEVVDAWKLDRDAPCSAPPSTCAPTWFARTPSSSLSAPVVVGETVYVLGVNATTSTVYAFDALGRGDCRSDPIGCRPLWTATFQSHPSGHTYTPSLLADGGRLYTRTIDASTMAGAITVFDAAGTLNCSGSPKTCAPLFAASLGSTYAGQHDAVDRGLLFASTLAGVLVFDARGEEGCAAGVCQPLRRLDAVTPGEPAASDGQVFVTEGTRLVAFDGTGATGCSGLPVVCTRQWSAGVTGGSASESPIVTSDRVLVNLSIGSGSQVAAFDRAGITGCGGAPKTCAALWRTADNSMFGFAHTAASGNLLVVMSNQGPNPFTPVPIAVELTIFDVRAQTSCSGVPLTCQPVRTIPLGTISPYDQTARPAVGSGRIVAPTAGTGFFVLGLP